jgi:hypothetical protein
VEVRNSQQREQYLAGEVTQGQDDEKLLSSLFRREPKMWGVLVFGIVFGPGGL